MVSSSKHPKVERGQPEELGPQIAKAERDLWLKSEGRRAKPGDLLPSVARYFGVDSLENLVPKLQPGSENRQNPEIAKIPKNPKVQNDKLFFHFCQSGFACFWSISGVGF